MSIIDKNKVLSGHIYNKVIKVYAKDYTDANGTITTPPDSIECKFTVDNDTFILPLKYC